MICVTATATNEMVSEIKEILKIPEAITFHSGHWRENLHFTIRFKSNAMGDAF